jgi:FMN-dependent NADH-azoreductase
MKKDLGACFEIRVDGKSRTYRDLQEIAMEAGKYFKHSQPQSEVSVRDVRDNSVRVIDGKTIAALDLAAARKRRMIPDARTVATAALRQ